MARVAALEKALSGPAKDPSRFRQEKAEQKAIADAALAFQQSPVGVALQRLEVRLTNLENYVKQLRGEEGITNDGPIFRLERRPTEPVPDVLNAEKVALTFCDEDDTPHTANFFVESGSIVPPL